MAFTFYQSGAEIEAGDRIRCHGSLGEIELLAKKPMVAPDPAPLFGKL